MKGGNLKKNMTMMIQWRQTWSENLKIITQIIILNINNKIKNNNYNNKFKSNNNCNNKYNNNNNYNSKYNNNKRRNSIYNYKNNGYYSRKQCDICDKYGHTTKECWFNPRNQNSRYKDILCNR